MQSNADLLRIENPEPLQELYALRPFDSLLLSFCADTPPGSSIEVQARVRRTDGTFTGWFSFGVWSPFCDRHSVSGEDALASMDTDTLRMKNGMRADTVQLRILPTPAPSGEMPRVRSVTLSCRDRARPKAESPAPHADVCAQAPCYSQMVREPSIGHVICSATTIAMQLNALGESVLPEEIALHNYDSAYQGCGNWAFSAAIAASYGYEACARYATLDEVEEEIAAGRPVGVSVHYTNDPANEKLPYLAGSPCTTNGHLMLLCGFTTDAEGQRFAIVHDPAAPENASVRRLYPLEQFLAAWNGRVCYFVRRSQEKSARFVPERVSARLLPLGGDAYALEVEGERIPLAASEGFPRTVAAYVTQVHGEKEADCDFAYGSIAQDGTIRLPGYAGQRAFVVTDRGPTYVVDGGTCA
ncbi:MAG: C39 family peptidase [Candidatus Spyradocola sp.]|jgi:hypothetical protein